jgi:hypothetical protein
MDVVGFFLGVVVVVVVVVVHVAVYLRKREMG